MRPGSSRRSSNTSRKRGAVPASSGLEIRRTTRAAPDAAPPDTRDPTQPITTGRESSYASPPASALAATSGRFRRDRPGCDRDHRLLDPGSSSAPRAMLRPILTGEHTWCQLFSEPGSGSDLAGLPCAPRIRGRGWTRERAQDGHPRPPARRRRAAGSRRGRGDVRGPTRWRADANAVRPISRDRGAGRNGSTAAPWPLPRASGWPPPPRGVRNRGCASSRAAARATRSGGSPRSSPSS